MGGRRENGSRSASAGASTDGYTHATQVRIQLRTVCASNIKFIQYTYPQMSNIRRMYIKAGERSSLGRQQLVSIGRRSLLQRLFKSTMR